MLHKAFLGEVLANMEFWLKNEMKKINMLLPITPRNYDIPYEMNIETVGATAVGDINTPTHRKPMNISLEGIFSVNEDYPFINKKTCAVVYAIDYVNIIRDWIDAKDIIRLIITEDVQTKINALFHIETIKYSEDNTSNGDINYTITLREYRPLKAITVTKPNTNKPRPSTKKTASTKRVYVVQSGDYLSKIARKFYGNSSKWGTIYNANKKVIGKNPNFIRVGQKLIIP